MLPEHFSFFSNFSYILTFLNKEYLIARLEYFPGDFTFPGPVNSESDHTGTVGVCTQFTGRTRRPYGLGRADGDRRPLGCLFANGGVIFGHHENSRDSPGDGPVGLVCRLARGVDVET